MKHGTIYAYEKGCRCKDCKLVKNKYVREWREKARKNVDLSTRLHGTLTTYSVYGCRCDECKEVWNAYHRNKRSKV